MALEIEVEWFVPEPTYVFDWLVPDEATAFAPQLDLGRTLSTVFIRDGLPQALSEEEKRLITNAFEGALI